MRVLLWYSAILVTLSIASLFLILCARETSTPFTDIAAILMYLPVGIYLWIKIRKEKQNGREKR